LSKIKLAPWQLSLIAAAFIVATSNGALFAALGESLDVFSVNGLGFLLTIVLLMLFVLNAIFLAFGIGWLQKVIISLFFIATAVFAYFSNDMGIVFDQAMFLNVAATVRDGNSAEAFELASQSLIGHVLIFGIFPSLSLGFVEIVPRRFFDEIGIRAMVLVTGLALVIGVTLPNYKYVAYFAREHRDMRLMVTPIYPLISLIRLARDRLHHELPFEAIDADAFQRDKPTRRAIGIMVVGETARADHFSVGGYAKDTNPLLEATEGVLFAHADACGTSTLFSVPCMFSIRDRNNYSPDRATAESNVLDILTTAGIQTVWIDNNSGCKDVCKRIPTVNLQDSVDESSPLYSDMGYYDEVLLQYIDTYLGSKGPDMLIVLHMLGSHGPAYSRRYPSQFAVFTPSCDKMSPTDCSDEEVTNAYDNTIVYTDYVLGKLIENLQARENEFDAFLFYASDHGESLGENGFYLHGLPYAIAPIAQTDVPFVVWISSEFQKNHRIDQQTIRRFGHENLSHDNISHTLLGFYNVSAMSYRPELDIFAPAEVALAQNAK
jgi:lipid A ethanolaminephosphotransferase